MHWRFCPSVGQVKCPSVSGQRPLRDEGFPLTSGRYGRVWPSSDAGDWLQSTQSGHPTLPKADVIECAGERSG